MRRVLAKSLGAGIEERFVISVKTDNSGTSADNQFTLPTTGSGYNYDIETSDGQTITGNTGNATITFPSGGEYLLKISGSFPRCYFNNGGDKLKLLSIDNFGIYALGSTSQESAFFGCSNLVINAADIGNFGNVISFRKAWQSCTSLTSFPLIDTSSGTNFEVSWFNCLSLTSFPLIDTSSGINFDYCWQSCTSLTSFSLIDTSGSTSFIRTWFNCSSLTSFPLIDTSSSTNFNETWNNCTSLTLFPLIDTSSGTNFNTTWFNCLSLTLFPLIDTGNATTLQKAWQNCSSLTSFPLIDTSSNTNFNETWRSCTSLTSFPSLVTSSGTNFERAWQSCSSLTSFPLIDTSSGTTFFVGWAGCSSLTSFPSNAFNTNIGTNFNFAFTITNLTTQSIDNILVSLDTNSTINGVFEQSGGQAPSATGLAAKDNLVAKGWTITYTA